MSLVVVNELLGGVHGVDVVGGKAGSRPAVAALAQEEVKHWAREDADGYKVLNGVGFSLSLSHSLFVIVFWLARSSCTFISRLLWTEVLIGEEVVIVVASHQGVEPLHLVVDRHRRVPGHPHPDCVLVHLLTNLGGEAYID